MPDDDAEPSTAGELASATRPGRPMSLQLHRPDGKGGIERAFGPRPGLAPPAPLAALGMPRAGTASCRSFRTREMNPTSTAMAVAVLARPGVPDVRGAGRRLRIRVLGRAATGVGRPRGHLARASLPNVRPMIAGRRQGIGRPIGRLAGQEAARPDLTRLPDRMDDPRTCRRKSWRSTASVDPGNGLTSVDALARRRDRTAGERSAELGASRTPRLYFTGHAIPFPFRRLQRP